MILKSALAKSRSSSARRRTWSARWSAWRDEFQKRFNADFYTGSVIHIYTLLGEAMQVTSPLLLRIRSL